MSYGENLWGQLGNEGLVESNPTPKAIVLPYVVGSPVQVATSEDHSVVLTSSGQIYTFGTSGLGSGNRFSEFRTPVAIVLPDLSGVPVQAAAGVSFSLVLTSSGQLYAFGYDDGGQLGNGSNKYEEDPTPTEVSLPNETGPPVQIAAGREFSLVLTSTGQLFAFGDDSHGQLGDGGDYFNPTPEEVTLPGATGSIVQIAAGEYHSLVLTSSGQLYTFGDDSRGQLGNGTSTFLAAPAEVTLPGANGSIVQIAAGWEHSLALTSSGQLYAFGSNESGQLGNGTSDDEPHATPAQVTLPGAAGSIEQIAAGKQDSMVVTSNGQLYAFGNDEFGQLGNGTREASVPTPTLAQLPPVLSVARGSSANGSLVIIATPLAVSTETLPEGEQGAVYAADATATGGAPPLHWSATGLPSGLLIDSASGQISGTPTVAGKFTVTLTATDGNEGKAEGAPVTLVVAAEPGGSDNPPGGSNNDTPGEPENTSGQPGPTLNGLSSILGGSLGNAPVQDEGPLPASGSMEAFATTHTGVTLTLTCAGSEGLSCSGAIALTAHERLRGHKLLALAADKRARTTQTARAPQTRTLRLATSTYQLPAGTRKTVTLTLGAAARKLLAMRGTLPAALTLNGTIDVTRTLSLKATVRSA